VDCLEHQTVHTNQSSPWRTTFSEEDSKTPQDIRLYKGTCYVPMVCKLTSVTLLLPRFRRNNYLLTPWCRVLEKLTVLQLVKKFPAFL